MNGAFRLGVVAAGAPGRDGDQHITWSTVSQWDHLSADESPGWAGYTLRQRIAASTLPAAKYLRFTFAASSAQSATVGACSVQIAGAGTLDFASPPVEVRVGGLPSFMVPANGTLQSDPINCPVNGSQDIVIAVALPSTPESAVKRGSGVAGWQSGYKVGAEADTIIADGYTFSVPYVYFVWKIEAGN